MDTFYACVFISVRAFVAEDPSKNSSVSRKFWTLIVSPVGLPGYVTF